MVKIEPFAVEQWMDEHETTAKYNVAETCCASLSIDKLGELSETKDESVLQLSKVLNYGEIRGSSALRENLSRIYSETLDKSTPSAPLPAENILITPGAILANFLVLYTLVASGDHVICQYPTYQQLYSVPASLGAKVDLWKARPENEWTLEIHELRKLVRPNTKVIIINNPNNPTGQILRRSLLQDVVDLACERGITVMSDEVYRPLFHSINPMIAEFTPSIVSMGYDKVVATGSLSKAYSLAGIRVGWIASRDPAIIEACAESRHYTTISVSQLDEQVATFALSQHVVRKLLSRNMALARGNLQLLGQFIDKHKDNCQWVQPQAGTTAFVWFSRDSLPVDAVQLCKMLLDKTGVMLVPGDRCFGDEFKGFVRVGYVCETKVLKKALHKLETFMEEGFADVPLSE